MKRTLLIVFACFFVLMAMPHGAKAQTCGFNAANDYICGGTGGVPLGAYDTPEIPKNDTFQPVLHPDGGYVNRPIYPVPYGDGHGYDNPPNPDCYECSGGGYGEFKEHLKDREGVRNTVYLDTLGNPTVGVGHLVLPKDNLEVGDTISDAQVDAFLDQDGQHAWDSAQEQMEDAGISDNPCFQLALGSVSFQLGSAWRDKFPKTWGMIRDGDYCGAAEEVADSRWAVQTPVRVADFQNALRELGGCGGANDDSGGSCGGGSLETCGGWTVEDSERAIRISETDDARPSYCARGVGNIMLEMGYPVTRGHAHDWDDTLPDNGWICDPTLTPENAPAGAILQYDSDDHLGKPNRGTGGATYGHVEIVTISASGQRQYVSDRARTNYGGTVPDNFQCAWVHPSMSDDDDC